MNDTVEQMQDVPAQDSHELLVQEESYPEAIPTGQETGQSVSPYLNMIQLAVSQNVELEKIQQLVELAERVEDRQAGKEMNMSLSRFQTDMTVVEKKGHVYFPGKGEKPATDFHFARLEDITEAIRPELAKNALSYRFELEQEKGASFEQMSVTVTCIITHKDGARITNSMTGYPDMSGSKNSIQALASTTTYLKRQTLSGALGIASIDMDDDGNQGGEPGEYIEPLDTDIVVGMDPERFAQLLPTWQGLIQGGKPAEDIIVTAATKGFDLSEEQKQQLIDTPK